MASICVYGINGGALYINDNDIQWRAQKLSLPEYYRNIVIPFEDVSSIKLCRTLLIFPSVSIEYNDGLDVKIVVFNRNRFIKHIEENTKIKVIKQ